MNKIVGLVALFMIFEIVRAQEYRIVFSGSGASGTVDSLKIENLSKGTILKMKGGDVLVLKPSSTGILHIREDRETDLWVFPNPAVHTAYLEFTMKEAGRTTIDLTDLSGKTVAFGNFVLEPGRHSFLLHLPGTGLFTARIRTGRFSASCRVSATGSRDVEAAITPLGTQPLNIRNVALKNALTEVTMAYSKGERLKITGKSGNNATVVMMVPDKDQNVTFLFTPCTDAGGKNYAAVQIGSLWWMAENLAWLPAVSPPSAGSATEKYYYVYGYNGNDAATAKVTANYSLYGVLYNWPAAVNGSAGSSFVPSGVQGACPAGWHLPSDAEWKQLEIYLGMTQVQADTTGYRGDVQGSLLKTTTGWSGSIQGTNSSGFSGLPAGNLSNSDKQFVNLGDYANWWTATEKDASSAWYRYLHKIQNTVNRNSYGKENGYSIRCVRDYVAIPHVITSTAESVTDSSAVLGGSVLYAGGAPVTTRGICYALSINPDTSKNKILLGSGLGQFKTTVKNLAPKTTYYARAYAVNTAGIAYGNQVIFMTKEKEDTLGYFTDPRDGKEYKWMKIGKQKWMTQNLAYLPQVFPQNQPPQGTITGKYYYVYGYNGTDVTAAKATENYKTYGVLYNNKAAMEGYSYSSANPSGRQCVCPVGWHLPSDAEWDQLSQFVSSQKGPYEKISVGDVNGAWFWKDVGKHLKSKTGWNENGNGTNDFGFNGLPSGARWYTEIFDQLGMYGRWWSTTLGNMPYSWSLPYNSNNFNQSICSPYHAISIRCVMD